MDQSNEHQRPYEQPAERESAAPVNPFMPGANGMPTGIPTRAQVREQRRTEVEDGFRFPLFRTGGVARVRRLSIQDRATIGRLPSAIQAKVNELLSGQVGANGRLKTKDLLETLTETADVADAFCVLAFMEPRLVATPAEVDESDPYCMCVTDLHPDERLAYFELVMSVEGMQARSLEPFRR